jgi:hypothetical protein
LTIKVVIKSTDFETKSGTASRTGKPYSIREQVGYATLGDEVRKIIISLGDKQQVYAAREYIVDDSSFTTNNFGQLVVGRLVLKPMAPVGGVGSSTTQQKVA